VETFDPSEVLMTIRGHLEDASFAVEDSEGLFRFTGKFPDGALAVSSERVSFEELLEVDATRVVVISPDHAIDDFLSIVERMGLHKVSYNVGWTAWLDIAPEGVNKATGLEFVRDELGVPRCGAAGHRRRPQRHRHARVGGRRGRSRVAMGQSLRRSRAVPPSAPAPTVDDGVRDHARTYFQA
jgi:hypothetical protein